MRMGWLRTQFQGTDFRKKWDGLWKQCLEEWVGKITPTNIQVHKVKAHRKASDGVDETDTRWIHGNCVADAVANRCLDEHMFETAGNDSAQALKAGKKLLKDIVARLVTAREALGQPPKPKRGIVRWVNKAKSANAEVHRLVWRNTSFVCDKCFRRFKQLPKPGAGCNGHPKAGPGAIDIAIAAGHRISVVSMTGDRTGILIVCTKCAAYSAERVVKLKAKCPGSSKCRQAVLVKLGKGKHPQCPRTWVDKIWEANIKSNHGRLGPTDTSEGKLELQQAAVPKYGSKSRSVSHNVAHPGIAGSQDCPDDEWDLAALADFFGSQP
jgi:hypothetical protein